MPFPYSQNEDSVGVCYTDPAYPDTPPFDPSERYPEYPDGFSISRRRNAVYDAVRTCFFRNGLDAENYGTASWNPLGNLVRKGDSVIIKPNWVKHLHPEGKNVFSIITHPSVIRVVLDYILIASEGDAEVNIVDSPMIDCDFDEILRLISSERMKMVYSGHIRFRVSFVDIRKDRTDSRNIFQCPSEINQRRVPEFRTDLKNASLLDGFDAEGFYGTRYDRGVKKFHSSGRHVYCLWDRIRTSDVLISIPKMKTHMKTGVSLNLKNMVGLVTSKECLVHFRTGCPDSGGDQYPENALYKRFRFILRRFFMSDPLLEDLFKILKSMQSGLWKYIRPDSGILTDEDYGNWPGNDTAWRMVCDINRIISSQRLRTFSILDGIVSGDGCGPLKPDPFYSGLVLSGRDFLQVDLYAIILMGLNADSMKLYSTGKRCRNILKEADMKLRGTRKNSFQSPWKS